MSGKEDALNSEQFQMILSLMRDPSYRPMTYQELAEQFDQAATADEYKRFLRTLTEMEDLGLIARSRQDRYALPEHLHMVRGKLSVHPRGFAFLLPDEEGQADVYIGADDLQEGLHGDIVLVRITKLKEDRGGREGRIEGTVVRVIERGIKEVVGRVSEHGRVARVLPDVKRIGHEIWIPEEYRMGAKEGEKVVVWITKYPDAKAVARGRAVLEGRIIEVLGDADAPGVDVLSIVRRFGLPEAFPDDVNAQAEAVPEAVPSDAGESDQAAAIWAGRRDLRGLNIVTIDGEDAKDLDDAVNVSKLENGNWLLGVHVADVSYYVTEGSPLDTEAYRRGTSVYLVDRVIPMLPKRLSNGICSLNPNVERLTMSCEMEIDSSGDVVNYTIFQSVIKTVERMTYSNVRLILEPPQAPADEEQQELMEAYREELKKRAGLLERYETLLADFEMMRELALILRSKRMRRGAIDFDFDEAKIIVDGDGKPVEIRKRERSIAEQIIEEFMLSANETVAAHVHWLNVPFIYRIHEDPDSVKIMNFGKFATNLGYKVPGILAEKVHPHALQSLLAEIKGAPEQQVLSTLLLRSMKQAKYSADNDGHFGLAAEFYTHFTSPIRRYPDLIVHRVLRELIAGGNTLSDARQNELGQAMPDIAKQSSERERMATEAERAVEAMKKAQFMLEHVGEQFRGVVSSVTGFGFFVELPNTVEGLIRLADLNDDYYHFVEEQMLLRGERTAREIRIGQEVLIQVARVSVEDGQIDFALVKTFAAPHRNVGDAKSRRGRKTKSGASNATMSDEALRADRPAGWQPSDDPDWIPSQSSRGFGFDRNAQNTRFDDADDDEDVDVEYTPSEGEWRSGPPRGASSAGTRGKSTGRVQADGKARKSRAEWWAFKKERDGKKSGPGAKSGSGGKAGSGKKYGPSSDKKTNQGGSDSANRGNNQSFAKSSKAKKSVAPSAKRGKRR